MGWVFKPGIQKHLHDLDLFRVQRYPVLILDYDIIGGSELSAILLTALIQLPELLGPIHKALASMEDEWVQVAVCGAYSIQLWSL